MPTKNTDIHELTRAEIARQCGALNDRRRAIVNERAELYASGRRAPPQNPLSEDERAARAHARSILNGATPPELLEASDSAWIHIDQKLAREQRGIDLALKVLQSKEVELRAVEAVTWAETNQQTWRELCREIVLCSVRLDAVVGAATAMIESCPDIMAVNMPMGRLAESRWLPESFLNELTSTALSDAVVTPADLKKARAR